MLKTWLVITGVAVILMAAATAPTQTGRAGGGAVASQPAPASGPARPGAFQPGGEMAGMDRLKTQMHSTDEEWKVIGPKLQKVIAARRAAESGISRDGSGTSGAGGYGGPFGRGRGGGFGGPGGGFGGPGGGPGGGSFTGPGGGRSGGGFGRGGFGRPGEPLPSDAPGGMVPPPGDPMATSRPAPVEPNAADAGQPAPGRFGGPGPGASGGPGGLGGPCARRSRRAWRGWRAWRT